MLLLVEGFDLLEGRGMRVCGMGCSKEGGGEMIDGTGRKKGGG